LSRPHPAAELDDVTPDLARLIGAQIGLHACMAGLRLGAPLLALRQGYSPLAIGILLALFALMQVFLALPAGRFADRHGLRRPVAFSVSAASLGAALAALFPLFPVLCISALSSGGASGAALIALQRHVGRSARTTAERKTMFSWLSLGPAMSNFLGPVTAGLLIDLLSSEANPVLGYRAAFALMGVMPLAGWLLVRRVQKMPPVSLSASDARHRAWDLMRDPDFRRLILVNWLLSACWDLHTFMVPLLGVERGLGASVIGAIVGTYAVGAAVIRLGMPFVAERLSEWRVLTGAMLVTGLLFGVYPLMPNALAMGACSLLLGFALGSVQPMIMSMLHQLTPEARHGEALGLRLMTLNSSSVVMPLLFGSAGVWLGAAGVFWFSAVMVAGGSRAAWRLKDSARMQAGRAID
jgi:MFS family permease